MVDQASLPSTPLRKGEIPLRELIDLYMAHYAGRDPSRLQRLSWWQGQIGSVNLQDLADDHVFAALESLAIQRGRFFAGKDADDNPIYRARRRPIAPATINRYSASLAAVITWAVKKRIAPKGYVHPCRSIERKPENNEKTRFLSDEERDRLLLACKASKWPLLYPLVLMALTTGARKGELIGLRWRDIDLVRGEATVGRTKNGDPRVLPLVPAVVESLGGFHGADSALVFASRRTPSQPYSFGVRFDKALAEARIRGVTFHTLRHSCASMLAKSGATLIEISELLGHRQLQMTKRYSHLATGHKVAMVNRILGKVR